MQTVKLFSDHTDLDGRPFVGAWTPEDPPSLDGVDSIQFDTETTGVNWHRGDKPVGISVKRPGDKARYLPFGHAGGNLGEDTVKRWAQRELRNKRLVGASIKFDAHMMRVWGVDLEEQGCTLHDVQHDAALLDDSRREFDLETLGEDFLHRGKIKGLDKSQMRHYHSSMVGPYAERDNELTEDLETIFTPMIHAEGLERVRALEDDVIWPVVEMEKNGAPIDEELLERMTHDSAIEVDLLLDSITKAVGFAFNPKKDWAKFYRRFRLPIIHFTEEGQPSFTDDILANTHAPDDVRQLITKGRRASKIMGLRSKFLIPYTREVHNGILRYGLHQLKWEKPSGEEGGTVTGRFSSSNQNIQQVSKPSKQRKAFENLGELPYVIRRLFVPSNGERWLSADAEQIEFRLGAHFFNSPRILEIYRKDPSVNFHKVVHEIVRQFVDITYDHVKNLNFCLFYGGGTAKAASMMGVDYETAEHFVALYERALPEVRPMIRKVKTLAERRGYVKTISGRRARFKNKERSYKGFNSVCQGGAADINKKKIVELHAERKRTGYLMRGTVHDETFGQGANEEVRRNVDEILNRQSYKLRVPILWKAKMGANWAEC